MVAIIAFFAQFVFIFNFFYSMYRGRKAAQNPWNSNTLEWTTPMANIHGNWPGKLPVVHRWAYDYSKPGQEHDFVPLDSRVRMDRRSLQHVGADANT